MKLEDYGWDSWFDDQYKSLNMHLKTGRVVANSDSYKVVCEDGVIDAGISDRLFYATSSDSELPVPGDWVLIISDESSSGYSIYDLLPRRSFLTLPDEENPREQIPAAANVDFILAAVPAGEGIDTSMLKNLIEVSRDWGAEPLFICYGKSAGKSETESFKKAAGDTGVIFIDSIDKSGLARLNEALAPRKTYAVTGVNADDVSAIISYLTDGEVFDKGVQSSKNQVQSANVDLLHILPSSALLLSVPLPVDPLILNGNNSENNTGGDDDEFGDIIELAGLCRFSDCRHINEPGCAIQEAIDNGELDYDYYKSFMKALKKEAGRVAVSEQGEVKKQKKSALD